jgi:putative addiction module killer protein
MNSNLDKSLNVLYEGQVFQIRETLEFAKWFDALRDRKASAKIVDRIRRAGDGNFGDVKSASGMSEMRIDHGPGYRVYFAQRGTELVILLCGGDKRTQDRDLKYAKQLRSELDSATGNPPIRPR